MSERYRRLVMEMVRPALSVFLQAFTTKPRNLLYYLVNKSRIEQRDDGDVGTKTDTEGKWRDSVRLAVTKNCFLVQNIVNRFNKCEGNSRSARDARTMALSELAVGFSYRTVVRVCYMSAHICSIISQLTNTFSQPLTLRGHCHFDYQMLANVKIARYLNTCISQREIMRPHMVLGDQHSTFHTLAK